MSLNFEDWKKDFLTDAEQMGLLKIHPEGKQLGDNEWWQKPERGLAGEVIDLQPASIFPGPSLAIIADGFMYIPFVLQ